MESKLLPVKRIVYSSVAVLSVAAVLWVLFPKARKAIAAVYTELATLLTNSSGSLSGGIQVIDFPIGIAATQDSVTSILLNAIVYSCTVQVVTPYSPGTVITVGRVGALDLLQLATDNAPTLANLYQVVQRTPWGAATLPVRVSVAGAPAVGAGFCSVQYSVPDV